MSEAQNQATENQAAIHANHDPKIDVKETTFNFRKSKDEETGVESKRASVIGKLRVPSIEGIIAILQDENTKGLELLQSAVEGVIVDYVKSALSDDATITTDNFNPELYTWDVIANLPDSDRRGRGIPKEVWEDFIKSYIETMPAIIGKSADVVKKQAAILAQKFQQLKNHEKKNELLPKFIEMLSLYVAHSPEAEQYSAPVEFLLKKAEQFMNADNNANLEEALGF